VKLREGKYFPDTTYKLLRKPTAAETAAEDYFHEEDVKLLYTVCDGGFHTWRCMQAPVKMPVTVEESFFSSLLESVRKDIECAFGITKRRFQLLGRPIPYQKRTAVKNVVQAACIFHNRILRYDGLTKLWDNSEAWQSLKGPLHSLVCFFLHSVFPDVADLNMLSLLSYFIVFVRLLIIFAMLMLFLLSSVGKHRGQ